MKLHRIYAVVLRHLFIFRRSVDRWTDVFYWPAIDLLMWGLTGSYIQSTGGKNVSLIVISIISGITLFTIVRRGEQEISINALEEIWNKNLINLFVSPLYFSEWVMSLFILGIIKSCISFSFAALLAFFLFKTQIFIYGFYLIPFLFSLIMTGWWIGFFTTGIILRYGTRIQALAWILIYVITPLFGVYYPLKILPVFAQKLALFIPPSYIFEGARTILQSGTMDMKNLYISFILNIIYLSLSLVYLKKSFNKVLEKGLVKVY
jgi:ABC-2 type transport system permease protein